MGVLNVTPDSFSDGGRFLQPSDALQQARVMCDAGAAIIDIGGESTRPGATAVPWQEEMDRVIPVIDAVCAAMEVPVCVDTSKPEVMEAAVAAGASMINDVNALRREGAMQMAARLGVTVCLVHMQGEPGEMQRNPCYRDVPGDIIEFLRERLEKCNEAGIEKERIVLDPGFGFGKTDRHNSSLLAHLGQFEQFGLPILVGLSRKRTLGNLTGRAVDERMPAGVAAALLAVDRGAHIVRTHDVAPTVDAFTIRQAVIEAG